MLTGNRKVLVTSNISYSGHTSLFLIKSHNYSVTHLYQSIFSCTTKYRKMFLSIWNI